MNKQYSNDRKFGIFQEMDILPTLKHCLSDQTIIPLKERYSIFDFISQSQRLIIEIKCRRNHFAQYKTTMIGQNKILEAESFSMKGYNIFFFIKFIDGLYYFNYNKDWERIVLHKDFEISHSGTQRRGKDERQKHAFIPIETLKLVKNEESIIYTHNAL